MSYELSLLVDKQLSSVCFVFDYIEFIFHEMIFRALAKPTIIGLAPDLPLAEQCRLLIGATVVAVEEREGERLRLIFDRERIVEIRLSEPEPETGEAAHFVAGPNAPVQVW